MATIDKKFLEGLKFRYSESTEVEGEAGVMRKQYAPKKRDLTPDDVLAVRDTGSEVIFVAADGQKYIAPKKSSKTA